MRADLVFGRITADQPLAVVSQMPRDGVIFSDGIEADHLAFNSGAIAQVGLADQTLRLIVPPRPERTSPGKDRSGWKDGAGCKDGPGWKASKR